MSNLKMVWNYQTEKLEVLEAETFLMFSENPQYKVIDFTEQELLGINVFEFGDLIKNKLKQIFNDKDL